MKKTNSTSSAKINHLIKDLLSTDMYHPSFVTQKNQELNTLILQRINIEKRQSAKDLYYKIKNVTDELAILAQAAQLQNIQVRMLSNQQFEKIQNQLRKLKNKLDHL